MNSILLAIIVFAGYYLAYHTYGKFLSRKIFKIDPTRLCPSVEFQDDTDFVPTNKHVLFGHHFTSIAGLGPIVGPAIAIIWGWVPAILWVFLGSIFMGAVHDFGSMVISLRNQGRSIGDIAAEVISPRVRNLFLIIIFFELWIVIAVFALIIALLFEMYPQAVIPVWFEIPIAIFLGHMVYNKGQSHVKWGIIAVILMYLAVIVGSLFPITLPSILGLNPLMLWIILLLAYAYIASTLPVQILLQPRDYINSHQLLIAMALMILGVIVAHPVIVAPAFNYLPTGAPPLLPFLFVVIACGAISGFHSLVSSGTSSKQCRTEKDARFIGYGGMLMEGSLSTLVIIAVGAGLGLGLLTEDGNLLTGTAAFSNHYASWAAASGLTAKLQAFVIGSANIIKVLGIPESITIAIMGVFIVSFAATTMDSATRIQRYVVTELSRAYNFKHLRGKHPATAIAIISAFFLAFYNGSGKGALTIWPLFGTVNQLLAGLALLVITIYLAKKGIRIWYSALPMIFILIMTGWAMLVNLQTYLETSNLLLFGIGLLLLLLEVWMIVETVLMLRKRNQVL
ncbi:MAG: carbon starvation protein A [Candidatus Marinimicrobia bacterium]|nr:carbon starvation protein A [Candidatus Neomarinimicrobiota bacterium]